MTMGKKIGRVVRRFEEYGLLHHNINACSTADEVVAYELMLNLCPEHLFEDKKLGEAFLDGCNTEIEHGTTYSKEEKCQQCWLRFLNRTNKILDSREVKFKF